MLTCPLCVCVLPCEDVPSQRGYLITWSISTCALKRANSKLLNAARSIAHYTTIAPNIIAAYRVIAPPPPPSIARAH